jgi:hypothetical protein
MESNNQERLIDDRLDAALKQYGAAEPRAGLERRILANLRSERAHAISHTWRWWPVMTVVTTMLLIGTGVLLKTHFTNPPLVIGDRPSVPSTTERPRASGNEAHVLTASRPHRDQNRIAGPAPRLEQFPSPQPLSEQEELLARYIGQFPHDAVLMARAQTQLAKQEIMERDLPLGDAVSTDSQQENR